MPISASVTNQQITASVGETQIDVSVAGGVGPTGSAGAAATVAVGTVTTGAPGSSASVVNAGSSSAAVLNFTIPAGATGATGAAGPQGPAGPSVSFGSSAGTACEGNDARLSDARTPTAHTHATSDITWQAITGWSASTAYAAGALVSKDGVAYRAATAHTSGMSFNPLDWLAVTPLSFPASHIAAGTIDVARLPVGTTSTTVAAGDHTHAQLHDRSHAITSSSDHTATAWRVFYSNGSGVVTELALGASGKVLQSNGATAAPTWETPTGGGSTSASDLTSGTLANARLTARARRAINLYHYSSFR